MSLTPTEVLRITANHNNDSVLGFFLNWGLYGALCTQVYLYYLAFPDDRVSIKVLVYSVYILESAQAFLLLYKGIGFYDFQIYDNQALSSLHKLPHTKPAFVQYTATSLIGGIVAFTVQSFYAYRLRIIGRSPITAIVIVSLAFLQLIGTVTGGSSLIPIPVHIRAIAELAWGIFSIACDTVIAVAMTYYLLRNNNSGWSSTNTVLAKLIRLAVETGAVTAIVAISYLVLLSKSGPPASTPAIVLGKVYSNALMVNFNHRIKFVDGRNDVQSTELTMPSVAMFPATVITEDNLEN